MAFHSHGWQLRPLGISLSTCGHTSGLLNVVEFLLACWSYSSTSFTAASFQEEESRGCQAKEEAFCHLHHSLLIKAIPRYIQIQGARRDYMFMITPCYCIWVIASNFLPVKLYSIASNHHFYNPLYPWKILRLPPTSHLYKLNCNGYLHACFISTCVRNRYWRRRYRRGFRNCGIIRWAGPLWLSRGAFPLDSITISIPWLSENFCHNRQINDISYYFSDF